MLNQDIEFEILNENGKNINCVIIASQPVTENEINIMYKREDEPANEFRYGKVLKTESSYEIKKDMTEEELISLRECFDNEVVNMVNNLVEQMEDK